MIFTWYFCKSNFFPFASGLSWVLLNLSTWLDLSMPPLFSPFLHATLLASKYKNACLWKSVITWLLRVESVSEVLLWDPLSEGIWLQWRVFTKKWPHYRNYFWLFFLIERPMRCIYTHWLWVLGYFVVWFSKSMAFPCRLLVLSLFD